MGIDPNIDLRAMVREVLREAIAARGTGAGAQSVSIRTDADLQAFIAQLAAPGAIEAVRSGALKFTWAGGALVGAPHAAPLAAVVLLDGVVSERKLQTIAQGTTVRLAASAVLTPMARDAGRRLGLKFERVAK